MVSYHANSKEVGLILDGTVLKKNHDRLKIHLDIDRDQNPDKAYFLPYEPELGNVMYTMLKIRTRACIESGRKSDGGWVATNSPRTNGGSCAEMMDVNKRYYTSEFGTQFGILPSNLYYSGDTNLIKLKDGVGEKICTGGQFYIHAKKDIHLKLEMAAEIALKAAGSVPVRSSANGL